MEKCPKCGGKCSTSYHDGQSDSEGGVACRTGFTPCRTSSRNEHLHYLCLTCGYDFIGAVKDVVKAI
jgi:hypothetical protein